MIVGGNLGTTMMVDLGVIILCKVSSHTHQPIDRLQKLQWRILELQNTTNDQAPLIGGWGGGESGLILT